jgi:ADP-heptose:LPS heptosyltransferase
VHRWCRLLSHGGISADPTDLALDRPGLPSPAPGAVVLHPGAGYPARWWPAARYAQVASRLRAGELRVVVTGSGSERSLASLVADRAGLPPDSVLAGRTGLRELAALVAEASLVVCGDTGMAHLATAYGTPSVVLFGPVSPHHWGPPPERAQHVPLWAGRTGDTFADHPDEGLLCISVADVVKAAEHLLTAGRRQGS